MSKNSSASSSSTIHRDGLVAVERLLNYRFQDKTLLEKALTHPSIIGCSSYQRLEFIGDAVLGLAFANFAFSEYPDLDPGRLSLLRSANTSTEKLARVALRNGLYQYLRRSNASSLDRDVRQFEEVVAKEGDEVVSFGGAGKAPKVLADITESVAAAIYVDCHFDLDLMWECFRPLLEPIVTLENIKQHPVTMLYEFCQTQGKEVHFEHWKKDSKFCCDVLVDKKPLGSGVSDQKDNAKFLAAKQALEYLGVIKRKSLWETVWGK